MNNIRGGYYETPDVSKDPTYAFLIAFARAMTIMTWGKDFGFRLVIEEDPTSDPSAV